MNHEFDFAVLVVLVLIAVSAFSGFWAVLWSICRMQRESSFLEKQKKEIDTRLQGVAEKDLRKWCEEHQKDRHLHLAKRVDTMLLSLENDPTKAKELPELHDLHELTLQDELGYTGSATLRTVISFLLILGILGTLTGVHGVVSDSSSEVDLISRMAGALLPSMVAVGSTVVLMLLRGVYSAKVDAFLEQLDFYTMTVLSPRLQPASDTQRSKNEITKAINQFSEDGIKVKAASDELKENTGRLAEQLKEFSAEMSRIEKLVQEAESLELNVLSGVQGDDKLLVQRLQLLEQGTQDLLVSNEKMTKEVETLQDMGQQATARYDDLTNTLSLAGARLNAGLDMVNSMAASSAEWKRYGEIIRGYEANVRALFADMDSVRQVYQKIEAAVPLVQSCKDQAAAVSTEVFQSAEVMKLSSDTVNGYVTKEFDLEADRRVIFGEIEAVRASMRTLDQSRKQLVATFRNRAKQAGIEQ